MRTELTTSALELMTSTSVREKLPQIDLPFNAFGYDRFGISRRHIGAFYTFLEPFYY